MNARRRAMRAGAGFLAGILLLGLPGGARAAAAPDLVFSALSPKIASGKVAIANTFKNQGTAPTAGTFYGAFYLSADKTFDASTDHLLGKRARTTPLNAGSSSSATSSFAVPASVPPGDYYVLGVIDSTGTQAESDESNNVSASAGTLSIRADLVVSAISATRSGDTLTIKSTVKNQGVLAASGPFRVDFYLSKDATITTADTRFGERTVSGTLAYGKTSLATTTLAIPAGLPAGTYRVGAIADGGLAVPETIETNNAKAASLTVTISAPPPPANVPPVASASASPTTGEAPLAVSFSGSSSTDSDGSIVSYAWSFGDGQTGTGLTVSHTYTVAGTYAAALTVTDDDGATASKSVTIVVSAPPVEEFSPRLAGLVPEIGAAMDVAVSGGSAFVASDPFGLSVADVTSPDAPAIRGVSSAPFKGACVSVAGTRAVVTGMAKDGKTRLWILDLSVPSRPRVLGEAESPSAILDVAVNPEGLLAVTAHGTAGVGVFDISNPAAPVLRGAYDTPGIAYAAAFDAGGTLAYVADGNGGLKILSLSNPAAPVLAGSLVMSGTQRDVAVSGGVAYVADQMGRLVTVDVTAPAAPRQLGSLVLGKYAFKVAVEGTRAVVYDSAAADCIEVIDITAPAAPVLLGGVTVDASGAVKGLALSGSRAYVAVGASGLKIYDLGPPPALRGTLRNGFAGSRIAMAGPLAVVTGTHVSTNSVRLRVVDLADPSQPRVLGEVESSSAILGVAVNPAGTLAVAAMGAAGVGVFDVSNPAAPALRSVYDTPGIAYAAAFDAGGTLAYVADGGSGLQILNLNNPAAPTLAGTLDLPGVERDVAVSGGVAYLVDQMGQLITVDVTAPAAPRQLGSLVLGKYAFRVAVEGARAVVYDSAASDDLEILDVSAPSSPVRLGGVAVDAVGAIKGLALSGSRAYVAVGAQGVKIYDLLNPAAPALFGAGYAAGEATDVAVEGSIASVAVSSSTINILSLFAP